MTARLQPRRRIGTQRHLRDWSGLLASLRIFSPDWRAQPTPPEKTLTAVTQIEGTRTTRAHLAKVNRPLKVLHDLGEVA